MAKTIYLLQFNNYFNRLLRGPYATLDDYIDTSRGGVLVGQITNMTLWNPADGVDTTITSNLGMTAVPDYALVCEGQTVLQRWYVIEAKRITGQQYRLTLHRDLLADDAARIMSNVNNFVERGWCPVSNDAIYNEEPISVNRIKTAQYELYDKSFTPWVVGYLALKKPFDPINIEFTWQGYTCEVAINQQIISGLTTEATAYYMFTMPWSEYQWDAPTVVKQYYGLAQAAAQAISRELSGAGTLIDIQLLPFCPMPQLITKAGEGSCASWYTPIADKNNNGAHLGYINFFYEPSIYGTIVKRDDNVQGYSDFTYTIGTIKKDSQTVSARLVSPNGNGCWEFVPAKQVYSDGGAFGFTFEMMCMPFQPYIKVESGFGRMYGGNYRDSRGLICGGDFSLPQVSDAWNTYQIQNKNYEVMFNRQIESLDLQQKWQGAQDVASAIGGTLTGIAGGALLGSGIGGVIGGVASAAAGAVDVYANRQLRADNRESTIQQHLWQLDNIQALPYSVTKVNNFNSDQPKVPYLEVYRCTDNESTNFDRYLALKSYTINRYGSFNEYVKPTGTTFLKGTIVRLDSISDDAHYAAAIADEVSQGFYYTKEGV